MSSKKNPVIYKVAIMILPIGVLIGTAAFMWAYYKNHQQEENKQSIIVSSGIRAKDLTDMLSKLTRDIDARMTDNEQGKKAHRQAMIFIEGRLGPVNTGFQIKRGEGVARGDDLWRSLWVDVRGQDENNEVLLVVTTVEGAGQAADSNLVASVMMLASAMAREEYQRTVRFVFLPLKLPEEEQNTWLIENCVSEDENCVGIIGMQEMQGDVSLGASEWQIKASDQVSQEWWQHVTNAKTFNGLTKDSAPAIWLSHSVYSTKTWENALELRVDATVPVLTQLRAWIAKASSVR